MVQALSDLFDYIESLMPILPDLQIPTVSSLNYNVNILLAANGSLDEGVQLYANYNV